MSLRRGLTTGTCAAAAAQAAVAVLAGQPAPQQIELILPGGQPVSVPILQVERQAAGGVRASVRKDAGDDPDVTHGMEVRATVWWDDTADVTFLGGEGVGTVTKPGLQIPPGQPAINPVPRQMIAAAIRTITSRGVRVEIAIPGGREMAAKTFNPRLGIEGGLSILGTTGIVRPYCVSALRDALRCSLDVAAACQVRAVVFVPGNIGARAARRLFTLREEQVVEVGNEWGFLLGELVGSSEGNRPLIAERELGQSLASCAFESLLVLGHPGKLAKLADGQWDTHSSRSRPPVETLRRLCGEVLGRVAPESPTTDGLLVALPADQRATLSEELARRIRVAVRSRVQERLEVAVVLVDMGGGCLRTDGDLSPWE